MEFERRGNEIESLRSEISLIKKELDNVKNLVNGNYSGLITTNNKINHQIGVGDVQISDKAKMNVMNVLNSGRLSHGRYLKAFEEEFARAHSVKYALTCSSGTDALRVAIECLKEIEGWNDWDEIIAPAVTFVATSNIIMQSNLKPIFVDVEKECYGINPDLIEEKITPKTRAIMVVHLFGMPCDMDRIMHIARKHNLKVIEDSCETMFARHNGRYTGSFGDFGCFSTYACHIITTGVGGIVTTNNDKYAVIAKSLMNHGRDSIYLNIDDDKKESGKNLFEVVSRRFKFERLGFSIRLTEMEGALGLAQMEEKEDIIRKRRENARFFTERLSKFSEDLQLPKIRPGAEHSFMMYPIVIKNQNIKKEELVNFLELNNIETRDMLPLINQPIYKKIFGDIEHKYPVAKWINEKGFYIGCQPSLTEFEKDYIIKKFEEFFNNNMQ